MAKVIIGINDLATTHPDIASQWHPSMNGNLRPCNVFSNSSKNVWWLCDKNHAYQQIVYKRTQRGSNCSYCSGHRVLKGYNDLATINPGVANEWHPKLNGSFTPYDYTANSGKRVWWLCPAGHEYQAVIRDRNQGTNCPSCNLRRQTSFGEQVVLYYIRKLYPDTVGRYKEIFTQVGQVDARSVQAPVDGVQVGEDLGPLGFGRHREGRLQRLGQDVPGVGRGPSGPPSVARGERQGGGIEGHVQRHDATERISRV